MKKRCPITYEEITSAEKYSKKGLRLLNSKLTHLSDFPFSADEQRKEAVNRAAKMSIQGVQPKLSTVLNIKKTSFEVVDKSGKFIMKPQNQLYPELPENEDVTMRMASMIGLEVPLHGLVYCADNTFTYFVKRFDRYGINKKYAVEDFGQLAGQSRDTKYEWTMEKLVPIIEQHCTFPALEKLKLFTMTIFSFLTGNEDMHLKNFSIIERDKKVQISPCYDLLNTSIPIPTGAVEQMALSLNSKKRRLKRKDLIDYFGVECLGLSEKVISQKLILIGKSLPAWNDVIDISFLSKEMKQRYKSLLKYRISVLDV